MKAYVAPIPHSLSRGIHRVAHALAQFAPADVEIMATRGDAIIDPDLLVFHVIGPEGWAPYLDHVRTTKTRYAVFQYCLRTTTWPHAHQWAEFWGGAEVVASYYNLQAVSDLPPEKFLHTPLGVDTTVFRPTHDVALRDAYLVGTSGYVDGMEVIGDWAWAVGAHGGRQFHLGPNLKLPHAAVKYRLGLTDEELAAHWTRCHYVSGLRRTEGFELPAYEGLACGARPVMFDREDARQWLGEHAEYIREDQEIRPQLDALLRGPYRPVTEEEIAWVRTTFSWQRMAEQFWARISR